MTLPRRSFLKSLLALPVFSLLGMKKSQQLPSESNPEKWPKKGGIGMVIRIIDHRKDFPTMYRSSWILDEDIQHERKGWTSEKRTQMGMGYMKAACRKVNYLLGDYDEGRF